MSKVHKNTLYIYLGLRISAIAYVVLLNMIFGGYFDDFFTLYTFPFVLSALTAAMGFFNIWVFSVLRGHYKYGLLTGQASPFDFIFAQA